MLIEKIPGATTSGIWIGLESVILLYFSILFVMMAINTHRFRYILFSLGCITIVSFSHLLSEIVISRQQQLVIYHVSRHTVFDYFNGNRLVSFQNEELMSRSLQFATQNYRWFRRATEVEKVLLTPQREMGIFQFGNLKIAVINDIWKDGNTPVDLVLIRDNPPESLQDLINPFDCNKIILDGSNHRRNIEKWQKEAEVMGLEVYDIQKSGAFIKEITR